MLLAACCGLGKTLHGLLGSVQRHNTGGQDRADPEHPTWGSDSSMQSMMLLRLTLSCIGGQMLYATSSGAASKACHRKQGIMWF